MFFSVFFPYVKICSHSRGIEMNFEHFFACPERNNALDSLYITVLKTDIQLDISCSVETRE